MAIEALEGVTDQDLFDGANADEAPADEAAVEAPEAPEEQPEQPRDEATGRYAEKPPEPVRTEFKLDAEVGDRGEKPAVDDSTATVPSFRLREETEARRRIENDLAQERADKALLRQRLEALERPAPKADPVKVEKPDPLLDPDGYEKYLETKFEEKLLSNQRETSLSNAHKTYKGEFEEAYAAAQKQVDPVLKMRMQNSRDPGETLIEWHREQKTRAEVGTDLNAFREREQERLLSDPAFLAKAIEKARGVAQTTPGANRQASPVDIPRTLLSPSLTRVAAAANNDAEDNDVSNDGLWRHANA